MELTFLGIGSDFNTKLGNTSAYIKSGNSLLLFDCGGTVFSKLLEEDENGKCILDGVTAIRVAITSLNCSCIGSLADLIYYSQLKLHVKPVIIYPNIVDLSQLLYKMGISNYLWTADYLPVGDSHGYTSNSLIFFLEALDVAHVTGVLSYAYLINVNDKKAYYCVDSEKVPDFIINSLNSGEIDEVYQNISGVSSNIAIYYDGLTYENALSTFLPNVRNKVYFIHYDKEFDPVRAAYDGFGFEVV